MQRRTLLDYLEDFRVGRGVRVCVSKDTARALELSAVAETAYRFARELSRKIVKGDAVLLWSSNSAEWWQRFWVCHLCVIAVPVDDSRIRFARRISAQSTRSWCFARRIVRLCLTRPQHRSAELTPAIERHSAEPFVLRRFSRQIAGDCFYIGTTAEQRAVLSMQMLWEYRPIEKEIQKYLNTTVRASDSLPHLLPLSHVSDNFSSLPAAMMLGRGV